MHLSVCDLEISGPFYINLGPVVGSTQVYNLSPVVPSVIPCLNICLPFPIFRQHSFSTMYVPKFSDFFSYFLTVIFAHPVLLNMTTLLNCLLFSLWFHLPILILLEMSVKCRSDYQFRFIKNLFKSSLVEVNQSNISLVVLDSQKTRHSLFLIFSGNFCTRKTGRVRAVLSSKVSWCSQPRLFNQAWCITVQCTLSVQLNSAVHWYMNLYI